MLSMVDLGWVAGFLEGEGCFSLEGGRDTTPRVEAVQAEVGPINKLEALFGGKKWLQTRGSTVSDALYMRKPLWRWYLRSDKAIQLMMTIWPLMSNKRKREIERCINGWKAAKGKKLTRRTICNNGHDLLANLLESRREDGKGWRKSCKRCLDEGLKGARVV